MLLENRPARSWPSATMMAPVSVESSTMACGLNFSCAYHMASHRIRRPSASVLMTSTVWPDIDFTTSPGRWALPSGMFSTRAQTADDVGLRLAPGDQAHGAGDGAGAAHVPLHVFHAAGRLQRDAAGVEGDALADQRDRLPGSWGRSSSA